MNGLILIIVILILIIFLISKKNKKKTTQIIMIQNRLEKIEKLVRESNESPIQRMMSIVDIRTTLDEINKKLD